LRRLRRAIAVPAVARKNYVDAVQTDHTAVSPMSIRQHLLILNVV